MVYLGWLLSQHRAETFPWFQNTGRLSCLSPFSPGDSFPLVVNLPVHHSLTHLIVRYHRYFLFVNIYQCLIQRCQLCCKMRGTTRNPELYIVWRREAGEGFLLDPKLLDLISRTCILKS